VQVAAHAHEAGCRCFVIPDTPIVDDIRGLCNCFAPELCSGKTCREMKLSIDRALACQAITLSGASEGMMIGEGTRYSAVDHCSLFDSLYYFYTKR
jgi:hypothetical protein